MQRFRTFLFASVSLAASATPLQAQQADLVLRNGKVVTLDADRPEATAIAVTDDRITAVGSDQEIAGHVGEGTRVIDLNGQLAIPGFIEGHAHFMGIGNARMILDLASPPNWASIVDLVADAVAEAAPGDWIEGRGWHQEKWDETPAVLVEGVPVHDDLSAVSPDNPVVLRHASGHASFVNARALELAGIDSDTRDPDGGEIVRDEAGRPTGLLRETAQGLVGRVRSRASEQRSAAEREAEAREMVRLASEEMLSKGVTSIHDAGVGFATVDFYRRLADEGRLPVRIYAMVRGPYEEMAENLERYRTIGYGNHHLTVRSIKQVVDGALGSHGAWLLEPYADMPRTSGLPTQTPDEIERTARLAIRLGYQVNTHAIGDRGNREVLDLYERTFEANGSPPDLRWRVEHAQHLNAADIPRFAELDVIASMQGIHACSDAPWVFLRLGEARAQEGAYVWQDLLESGAIVINGTDAPVEDVDPLASFHCSVTRLTADGSAFFPDNALTREQALRSYTSAAAYGAFEEDLKGTLTAGKLADITVLSRDILTIPAEEILQTEVVMTIVGGEVAFER